MQRWPLEVDEGLEGRRGVGLQETNAMESPAGDALGCQSLDIIGEEGGEEGGTHLGPMTLGLLHPTLDDVDPNLLPLASSLLDLVLLLVSLLTDNGAKERLLVAFLSCGRRGGAEMGGRLGLDVGGDGHTGRGERASTGERA